MSRVAELLEADAALYRRKAADYAPDSPFENFESAARFAERVGGHRIDPVDACLVLIGVKLSRLQTVTLNSVASNETLLDTVRDCRVYLAILEAMVEARG